MNKLVDMLMFCLLGVALTLLGLHAIVHGADVGLFLMVVGCLGMLCGLVRMNDADDE